MKSVRRHQQDWKQNIFGMEMWSQKREKKKPTTFSNFKKENDVSFTSLTILRLVRIF